jgi:hypothetical protein
MYPVPWPRVRQMPSGRLRWPQQLGSVLRAWTSALKSTGPVSQRLNGPWLRPWPRCARRRLATTTSVRSLATTTATWGRRTTSRSSSGGRRGINASPHCRSGASMPPLPQSGYGVAQGGGVDPLSFRRSSRTPAGAHRGWCSGR